MEGELLDIVFNSIAKQSVYEKTVRVIDMGLDTNLDKVSGATPEKDLADEIAERTHLHLYLLFVFVIYFLLERESIEIEVKVWKGLPEGLPSLGQNTGLNRLLGV